MADISWKQAVNFARWFFGSIVSLSVFVTAWIYMGFPQAASKDYVDAKFTLASDNTSQVKSQVVAARIAINRMTRQSLEAEQYRLTQQAKTDNSFDIQRRLHDISEELADTADERKRLLGPGN